MIRRMLIDATAPNEVRVAVVETIKDGNRTLNRLEDYDSEKADRKPSKGNIFLAQVSRVEASLQAAFVNYKLGPNGDQQRQGFLAFPEIHTDYYRVPTADREALEAEIRAEQADNHKEQLSFDQISIITEALRANGAVTLLAASSIAEITEKLTPPPAQTPYPEDDAAAEFGFDASSSSADLTDDLSASDHDDNDQPVVPEMLTGGDFDNGAEVRKTRRRLIRYKIQEVIKRRQIMLVQVVKEERGSKGAAVTTYISLPGRYCVLMPNSTSGGGVSRKINNHSDRRRMREVLDQLHVPDGMSVILRTAGLERDIEDIRRDLDYLLRLWDQIRELTLKSTAPALVYEEGDLIRRSIRDLHNDQIAEILIAGDEAYATARDFMQMLMPTHVDRVKLYRDPTPLFARFEVEKQIDTIHEPTVALRSGGYLVINSTEALVAVDVNSGRATKERNIEETALKTNLEAAQELARQIRLRDLAGLVVVDFIDMEETRNRIKIERCLKEAMKNDRARIQIGRISSFGLLELSRQRLRPSLSEADFSQCPTCAGRGMIRSVESSARTAFRALEDDVMKHDGHDIVLTAAPAVAIHMLNDLRQNIINLEQRHGIAIQIQMDDHLIAPAVRIERSTSRNIDRPAAVSYDTVTVPDANLYDPSFVPVLPAAPARAPRRSREERSREDRNREDRPARDDRPRDEAVEGEEEATPRRGRRRRGANLRTPSVSPADMPQPDLPDNAFAPFTDSALQAEPIVPADQMEVREGADDEIDENGEPKSRSARAGRRRGGRGRRPRFEGATPDYSQINADGDDSAPFDADGAPNAMPSANVPTGVFAAPHQAEPRQAEPRQAESPANDSSDQAQGQDDGTQRRGWWQRLLEG